jgi:hypothetical protein
MFKNLYQTRHHKHIVYALPNSLKDSNASPKMKTTKEEGVEVRSLAYNISKVRGVCWNSGMGIRMNDKWVNYPC